MMDFRTRLEQNRAKPVDGVLLAEQEPDFSCEYFATSRIGSPTCIELRLPGGIRKALPYAYFTEMTFDVDAGIEIISNGKKIRITGRNLAKLFDYLVAYRVRYVQSNIGGDQQEDGLFVQEILIEELND